MLRRALPVAVLLLVGSGSASFAACPLNHFSIGISNQFSSLPVDSRTYSGPATSPEYSTGSYNVPQGTLSLAFISYGAEVDAGVYVEDDFSIVGLPDGTPVSLTAHMAGQLRGSTGPPIVAFVQATLKDFNGDSQTAGFPALSYDLSLPIQATAGQTFRLHFELNGYGHTSATTATGVANAAFSFAGLPPGVVVTSCQGFFSGPPVATRLSTWGRVKSIYR
jgi:hypothetical protein